MADSKARKELADRAAEIWKGGGVSYSEAVDQALAEKNPTGNPTLGERLLYSLLNVDEPFVKPVRYRSGARRADMGDDTAAGGPGATLSDQGPAPDGDDTFKG